MTPIDEEWSQSVDGEEVSFHCVTSVSDIPYSSYFKIHLNTTLRPTPPPPGTVMKVRMDVEFVKSTVWSAKIRQTTTHEYLSTYTQLLEDISLRLGQPIQHHQTHHNRRVFLFVILLFGGGLVGLVILLILLNRFL